MAAQARKILHIRGYLLAGIFTVVPLWVTWVIFEFSFQQLTKFGIPWVRAVAGWISDDSPAIAQWFLQPWSQNVLAALLTLIGLYLLGWLVSRVIGRRLYARLMQPFETGDDWRIWLGTSPRTRKIAEISHNENVLLAFFQCEPWRRRNGRRTGNAGDGRGPEKKVLARRIRHVLAGRPGQR